MDDNINVSLTTTKHILATNDGSPEALQKLNTPICIAQMTIPIPRVERKKMAQLCKEMAKTVYIDTEKMYVYIGEGRHILEAALVEYSETDPHEYATEFFKQWKKLEILMFEFILLNFSNQPIFSLRGIWNKNRWHSLKIHKGSPALNVLKKPLKSWGTFSTHELRGGIS